MTLEYAATLILLRHGESEWNALNLFTGWVDVDLTEKGRAEAVRAGELIKGLDPQPDVLYTSLLARALRPPAPPDRAGQRIQPGRRSALRGHPGRAAAHRMPQGRGRAVRALLHRD